MLTTNSLAYSASIEKRLSKVTSRIAPLWTLENFVAVNPYLGMAEMKFEQAMDFLEKTSESRSTLTIDFYLKALAEGKIIKQDIEQAIEQSSLAKEINIETFIKDINKQANNVKKHKVQIVGDVASTVNGKKWLRFMIDRISFWASSYFDKDQAIWNTSYKSSSDLYSAWKKEAEIDLGTEAMGLKGFRNYVKSLPLDHKEAALNALNELDIPPVILEHYLNALLMKLNGWAGIAARLDWESNLKSKPSEALEQFLSILLVWEVGLLKLLPYKNLIGSWKASKIISEDLIIKSSFDETLSNLLILQNAFDIALQRQLIKQINSQNDNRVIKNTPKKVQAIFCIDVRSETFRRNLETASNDIETLGFAGFFGFPINYVPLGHKEGMDNCPVLISSTHTVKESVLNNEDDLKVANRRTLNDRLVKIWKNFKSSAVSCFGFVSPLGLFFLPKLITDLFGITRPISNPNKAGISKQDDGRKNISLEADITKGIKGIPQKDRLQMAQNALTAMSLTEDFAPIVLIAGHGSSTVNNPHATGLDCGACGGHSGEANAKVAAAVLNDKKVRLGLKEAGIIIPDSTIFIAGLHDTTTDQVQLFTYGKEFTNEQIEYIEDLEIALKTAGQASRRERASRMMIDAGNVDKKVIERSKDWSQVRPEWGLAGCSSFIVAPRERTKNLNLSGKSFMHTYNWQKDKEFKVLEAIMTAPMVVTSWINLQYYASTVDNKKFGAGNKALHNVVGGVGVLEGFAGDLRVGLPWQSVNDGVNYQHEPNRLNVIIEAPVDEMSKILERNEHIRHLCDNNWIYLFAMNSDGKVVYKYIGNLEWEVVSQ